MGTFLVTGAAGFIGSNLCDRLLAEGHQVIGVDDLSTGHIANLAEARSYAGAFTFTTIDVRSPGLRDLFDLHKPGVVMHLAAQTSVRRSMATPALNASVNLMGLLNVLACAADGGARRIVFASNGGAIYGEPRTLPVREAARSRSRPLSPYGITKKVAEDYLAFYRRQHGLEYVVLALSNVYGPRQDPQGETGVVAIVGGQMLAGKLPTVFGDGKQTRDFVFVDDAVHAFALAAARGSGRVLNVGSGVETRVNDIVRRLARLTGFPERPQFAPPREGESRRNRLDVRMAARALGWEPWTTLDEGLRQTVHWLRTGTRRSFEPSSNLELPVRRTGPVGGRAGP